MWGSLQYHGGQTHRKCRRRVSEEQPCGRRIFSEALNSMSFYLADTPLKMKSTDSSRIPADSYSSNLVFRSSFFRCMSTITEFRNSTWESSYCTLPEKFFRSQFIGLFKTFSISLHRNIFALIERNWIDVSMVKDSLRSIMRSFCGKRQQIKEVFKVDTGAAQYRKLSLYNILYLQYSF